MSPRTQKQFREIREEKRTLIMDVALEHFANNGFHATTINHIAEHAAISKGLMYNYFNSKEGLLAAIIQRSVSEVYEYFDIDRDGYLTEGDFEFFIRKMAQILKEKQSLWRLFLQLMMQNAVREQFLNYFLGGKSLIKSGNGDVKGFFLSDIIKTITEYFIRKKDSKPKDYDPLLEMNMFILTMKGFAITYIYMDQDDENYFDKTVNNIIELYK
jgi:AcrR family transcriptional regulator